jgi:hypothetical protein
VGEVVSVFPHQIIPQSLTGLGHVEVLYTGLCRDVAGGIRALAIDVLDLLPCALLVATLVHSVLEVYRRDNVLLSSFWYRNSN